MQRIISSRFALISILAIGLVTAVIAADPAAPWKGQDIGDVNTKGSVAVDKDKYTIKSSGGDIWGQNDGFYFVTQPLNGDGTISARVESIEDTDGWAKAGVMIRDSDKPNSFYAYVCVTPGNGAAFQRRSANEGDGDHSPSEGITAPYWVKLVRAGDNFTGFVSKDGKDWQQVGDTVSLKIGKNAMVGLAVTAHNNDKVTTAVIDNVKLEAKK